MLGKGDHDVVIVDGVRTPFAKADTKLAKVHPAQLGQVALKELLARTEIPLEDIEEVIVGNTGNPPDAVNIARVIALRAGLGNKTSAFTVHRNCASALESITTGYDRILSGSADVVVAGGTESMSQMPLLMPKAIQEIFNRLASAKTVPKQLGVLKELLGANVKQVWQIATTSPFQKAPYKPIISIMEGLTDPFVGENMGQTAETLAKEFGLSRNAQDEFALRSHKLAAEAMSSGRIAEETTPVYLAEGSSLSESVVTEDIGPRAGQTMEALSRLKPFFDRETGSVTPGNSCPITDGAAMVLLMRRRKAEALGLKPLVKIRGYGYRGLEPERMGLGPAYATPVALQRAGLSLKDMDRIEINEAFAAQVLSCVEAFSSKSFGSEKLGLSGALGEVPLDKLNVNGGAIAFGHPVGATGSRLVLTLMKELKRQNLQFGLATLCIGGGQGGAIILENEA